MSNTLLPRILASMIRPHDRAAGPFAAPLDRRPESLEGVVRQLYFRAGYCVLLLGAAGEIVWANPMATDLLAAEFESLDGKLFGSLLGIDPRRYECESRLDLLLAGGLDHF